MRLTLSLHGAVTVAVTDKATQLKEAGHEIISLSVGASAEHEQLHTQTLARLEPPKNVPLVLPHAPLLVLSALFLS